MEIKIPFSYLNIESTVSFVVEKIKMAVETGIEDNIQIYYKFDEDITDSTIRIIMMFESRLIQMVGYYLFWIRYSEPIFSNLTSEGDINDFSKPVIIKINRDRRAEIFTEPINRLTKLDKAILKIESYIENEIDIDIIEELRCIRNNLLRLKGKKYSDICETMKRNLKNAEDLICYQGNGNHN